MANGLWSNGNDRDTSLELIDFGTLIIDIKLNRHLCDLPDSIKIIANEKDQQDSTNQLQNPKKRKLIGNNGGASRVVINEDQVNKWKLADNELWQAWRHKVGLAPALQCNLKLCLKFHVKGICFDDCTNKASHKRLNGNDYKITDDLIRKIQSNIE